MHEVFISYAKPDREVAEAACRALEAAGVKVWIAPRDVYEGQPYAECIVRALREAKLLVLVFSSHSNASGMVLRELECAASLAKPLLPVRIEDVTPSDEMKFFVGREHWLEAVTRPVEPHLARLVEAAKRIARAGTTVSGAAPTIAARAAPRSGRWALLAASLAVVCVAIVAIVALGPGWRGWAGTGRVGPRGEKQAAPGPAPDPQRVTDKGDRERPKSGLGKPGERLPGAAERAALATKAVGLTQVRVEQVANRVVAKGVVLNGPELDAMRGRLGELPVDLSGVTVDAAAVARLVQRRLVDEGFEAVTVRDYVGKNKGPEVLRIEFKRKLGKGPDEVRAIARQYVSNDAAYVTLVPE